MRERQRLLAAGSVVEASRATDTDLSRTAIGSYGSRSVANEVELDSTDNVRIVSALLQSHGGTGTCRS